MFIIHVFAENQGLLWWLAAGEAEEQSSREEFESCVCSVVCVLQAVLRYQGM